MGEVRQAYSKAKLPHGLTPTVARDTCVLCCTGDPREPKATESVVQALSSVGACGSGRGSVLWLSALDRELLESRALVQRMICLGSGSADEAKERWGNLFNALSVRESDDIWARWLQGEFESWSRVGSTWSLQPMSEIVFLPVDEWDRLQFPAKQFVRDLDAVLRAKNSMTRRQWISLLEAIVRLGAVAHSLWLCDVNDFIWRALKGALDGKAYPPSYLLQELANRGPYLQLWESRGA